MALSAESEALASLPPVQALPNILVALQVWGDEAGRDGRRPAQHRWLPSPFCRLALL